MLDISLDLERLLTARQTRQFFGDASDMWLWRRLNDPDDIFPRPVLISGRRFFRVGDLLDYRNRMAEPTA